MNSITRYKSGRLSAAISCLLCLALIFGPDPIATSAFESWVMGPSLNGYAPTNVWLLAYLTANVISVRFVRQYVAARWILASFVISHVWAIAVAANGALGAAVLPGLCLCWAAASFAVYRYRADFRLPSAYGIWVIATLLLYLAAIKFEVRDVFVWSAAYPSIEVG